MDWLGDFLAFCLDHGFGGLALLAIAGCAVLIAALGVLRLVFAVLHGAGQLGQAFADGWRGGPKDG